MVQSINGANGNAALIMAELRTAGVEAAQRNADQMRANQTSEHAQAESAQYLSQAYEASRPARAATPPSGGEGFRAADLVRSSHDLLVVPERSEPVSYNIRAGADGVTGHEALVRNALDRLPDEARSGSSILDGLRALRSDDRPLWERIQDLMEGDDGSTNEEAQTIEIEVRRRMATSRG